MALKHFRANPQPSAISVQAVGIQDVILQIEILLTEKEIRCHHSTPGAAMARKALRWHLPESCGWVWWPQHWEKLWSPPPIPHLWHYKQLKVPEQTGSACREKGRPQSLSQLGKLRFPQSPPCCRGQRADPCTGIFRNEAQPWANPSVSHCLEFSCSPARAESLPGLQGKYSKFVWLWFSTWHRNHWKCHPEHSQEELDPKPLERRGNAAIPAPALEQTAPL